MNQKVWEPMPQTDRQSELPITTKTKQPNTLVLFISLSRIPIFYISGLSWWYYKELFRVNLVIELKHYKYRQNSKHKGECKRSRRMWQIISLLQGAVYNGGYVYVKITRAWPQQTFISKTIMFAREPTEIWLSNAVKVGIGHCFLRTLWMFIQGGLLASSTSILRS